MNWELRTKLIRKVTLLNNQRSDLRNTFDKGSYESCPLDEKENANV